MATDIKLFNKWSFKGVIVVDQGLVNYINLQPIIIPKTNGYQHNNAYYKTKINIVERLITRLFVTGHKGKKHKISTGHNTGKALSVINKIKQVFENIEKITKENPIQVLVTALENSSPREEVITIERSGARYAQAVDVGPQRRLDLALRNLAQGASHKSFDSNTSLVDNLTEEIIADFRKDQKGFAYSKKIEVERMAASAK